MEAQEPELKFRTRRWVKPEDLNPNHTLFGGSLLKWIDEEAVIYAILQLNNPRVVTKFISEINFISAPRLGDIIELGIVATDFGRTSITLKCEVRNKITHQPVLAIEKLVFVNVDENGKPVPHGKTAITFARDRLNNDAATLN
ncbi:acyl-CoA thioesterase [Chitinophaga japonensis]|uniref:Acyl-CoA hydrolase n=1 Tax=Chitinophaga japonensis TaxID=104662 RepID=A0A562TE36_CHIJA|nr:hotdog domain-containing protein [Chitinophaga japonensis]TWI91811.1 acyl-CoA hydrolase [Chitinophaga japonensis]